MQDVCKADHLKPCCISLPLSNEKKKTSLSFAQLPGPEGEMCPVRHTGRETLLYPAPPLPEDGITLDPSSSVPYRPFCGLRSKGQLRHIRAAILRSENPAL